MDLYQLTELGVKKGQEITNEDVAKYEQESQFGKLYARTLDYCLMRPHSSREIKDYLWRKTRDTKYKSRRTGEIKEREGVSQQIADRVYDRLVEKGYVDDEKFTRFWIENRNLGKGSSRRKLENELRVKGVSAATIDQVLRLTERNDQDEIKKIIAKKRRRYPDHQKLMQYLARQGFSYDDIKSALSTEID